MPSGSGQMIIKTSADLAPQGKDVESEDESESDEEEEDGQEDFDEDGQVMSFSCRHFP